jgi:hypothetical protein
MKKCGTFFMFIILVFPKVNIIAQETLSVSKPLLEIHGENLNISYDILNSKPGERYSISLEVTDSKGSIINAQSITGDIGQSVEGGKNKKITWNYTSDNVKDEVNIYVKIVIRKYQASADSEQIAKQIPAYTRGRLLLQSVVLPGLGLTKLNDGKPYWIMGVAGYGLVAGSIIFNSSSKSNYNDFLNSNQPQQEASYYKKYEDQKTISIVCAISAVTIWVADLILVLRSSAKLKDSPDGDKNNKLSMFPDYKFACKAPVLTLTYKF